MTHDAFTCFLKAHHNATPDEVEVSESKGYWRFKKMCGGLTGGCMQPIHGCMLNEGGTQHTVQFIDKNRNNGRFASPYATWLKWQQEAAK